LRFNIFRAFFSNGLIEPETFDGSFGGVLKRRNPVAFCRRVRRREAVGGVVGNYDGIFCEVN
jgi:hypothetical protein